MELVRIALEADDAGMIEGREFEECHITGPAMLAPLEGVTFESGQWEGSFDSIFLAVEPGRSLVGIIGLRDVAFRRCRFTRVSIVGPPELIEKFGADFLQ